MNFVGSRPDFVQNFCEEQVCRPVVRIYVCGVHLVVVVGTRVFPFGIRAPVNNNDDDGPRNK